MNVELSPEMRERLEELANERGVSVEDLILEALEDAYGPQWQERPEPWPVGSNLKPPRSSPGFLN